MWGSQTQGRQDWAELTQTSHPAKLPLYQAVSYSAGILPLSSASATGTAVSAAQGFTHDT